MSMSTNLTDLPGGNYEEPEELDFPSQDQVQDQYHPQQHHPQQHHQQQYYGDRESFEPVSVSITKKNDFFQDPDTILEIFTKEIFNEENLLLFAIIFVSLHYNKNVDEYTRKIMNIVGINASNGIIVNILKCVLLLVIFILAKHFILPKLQLS
jgi:hypothetical protein